MIHTPLVVCVGGESSRYLCARVYHGRPDIFRPATGPRLEITLLRSPPRPFYTKSSLVVILSSTSLLLLLLLYLSSLYTPRVRRRLYTCTYTHIYVHFLLYPSFCGSLGKKSPPPFRRRNNAESRILSIRIRAFCCTETRTVARAHACTVYYTHKYIHNITIYTFHNNTYAHVLQVGCRR